MDQLPLQVDHGQPPLLVFPGSSGMAKMLGPANKVAAHRPAPNPWHQPLMWQGFAPRHAPCNPIHHRIYAVSIQARQEAVHRGEVGNGVQLHGGTSIRLSPPSENRFASCGWLCLQEVESLVRLRREGSCRSPEPIAVESIGIIAKLGDKRTSHWLGRLRSVVETINSIRQLRAIGKRPSLRGPPTLEITSVRVTAHGCIRSRRIHPQ